MIQLTVTDVRAVPGDSAFLIDDGETSVLYDTGFGFTGFQIGNNIEKILGNRQLDYIFLTHSHYDHALGSAYILQKYPHAKVVAGTYAKKIFEKPSARAVMRQLDQSAARTYGIHSYPDLIDGLKVDISLEDADPLACGRMRFTAVALPGHTRCSMGFYLEENKLLLGTETLGVYFGKGTYLPSYLVGYEMTMESFRKAKALDIESILLPHYGIVTGQEAADYLTHSEAIARDIAAKVQQLLRQGKSKEQILQHFEQTYYQKHVEAVYPREAFLLNSRIMIDLLEKELE